MTGSAEAIKELKAAILAIEWEINDEAIHNLLRAIEPLNKLWLGQKPLLVCLQVIGTLGQYIKKAKEKAHPEAIKLLPAVFSTLEKVVTDPAMDEKQMVVMVRAEVEKYNRLKGELAKHRGGGEAEKTSSPVDSKAPEPRTDAAIPPSPPPGSPVVSSGPGGGGSTIRDLMDQKEDPAVAGAFSSIFQEMVTDTAKPASPPPQAPRGMPSSSHLPQEGDKEFVPDRIDGEVFQEADDLLDDFFSDENLNFPMDDSSEVDVALEDETVQVDVGRISSAEDIEQAKETEALEEEDVELANLERIIREIRKQPADFLFKELADELEALANQYPRHSSMGLFLQWLGSVGRHMDKHRDIALEKSSAMLQNIYDRLVHSLFTMQPQQNILDSHHKTLTDYISWFENVVAEIKSAKVAVSPQETEEDEMQHFDLPPEMVAAVKKLVKDEMEKLKKELLT